MLLLLFDADADRYALDVRQIVEVLPLVRITLVPHPPQGMSGLLNYRGGSVPVIDLTAVLLGRASRARLSTRLVVVGYPDRDGRSRLLGLIAEHATETTRRAEGDFVASGVTIEGSPYLGPVATDARGMVQLVDVSRLLPAPVRDVLFHQPAGH